MDSLKYFITIDILHDPLESAITRNLSHATNRKRQKIEKEFGVCGLAVTT